MKYIKNMSMPQLVNFDRDVVNYINDNCEFISNAEIALEHYIASAEAFNESDAYLSEEQKERFLSVANTLFANGHVPHAGILKSL